MPAEMGNERIKRLFESKPRKFFNGLMRNGSCGKMPPTDYPCRRRRPI
jgi:hypothetical protein